MPVLGEHVQLQNLTLFFQMVTSLCLEAILKMPEWVSLSNVPLYHSDQLTGLR